ncbi:hypothetical protein IWX90DRAFT_295443 [Phyllosticta citrichinensis]|uniref:Uncharacterized protein n=1 Tax=Phyllosticta citrichinensis TaxID=1130410 RepID=A0ABR1XKW8_9PEZI
MTPMRDSASEVAKNPSPRALAQERTLTASRSFGSLAHRRRSEIFTSTCRRTGNWPVELTKSSSKIKATGLSYTRHCGGDNGGGCPSIAAAVNEKKERKETSRGQMWNMKTMMRGVGVSHFLSFSFSSFRNARTHSPEKKACDLNQSCTYMPGVLSVPAGGRVDDESLTQERLLMLFFRRFFCFLSPFLFSSFFDARRAGVGRNLKYIISLIDCGVFISDCKRASEHF